MADNLCASQATPSNPDWCQLRETVLMLELSAGQIDAAMHESNEEVSVLSSSFMQLASLMQSINETLTALPDSPDNTSLKETALGSVGQVAQLVQQSIVAFQFYDKLSQRLDHVCHSLAGLSEVVGDPQRLAAPAEWSALQGRIRAKYSMLEEVAMFDAVLAGMSVKEALAAFITQRKEQTGSDIELF